MSKKVLSAAVLGLDCYLVEVEADTTLALPGIFIVGLPDKAVDESRERVRSAIKNSGFEMPRGKVTINLAPADLKKAGPAYDLPIAVSILLKTKQIVLDQDFDKQIFIGELALDGQLRGVNGVLSVCLAAKAKGITTVYLPSVNAAEAGLVSDIEVYPCDNLRQLGEHLLQEKIIEKYQPTKVIFTQSVSAYDMAHVKGQSNAKRALEIVAAGGHNILMSGPPGSGKTLLAKTLTSIMPKMTMPESLEVTRIYSVAGLLPADQPLILQRPFRSPHHTASGVALVGGGAWPKPGEISLAHRGILFLDEFPEFPRVALENLRQPLEDGSISISRAAGTLQFPAKFILIAAMNPCPCGYANDPDRGCSCLPYQILSYQKKISGPLLDRIDLHVEVPRVKFDKIITNDDTESSATVQRRAEAARQIQRHRFKDHDIITNSEMSSRLIEQFCQIDKSSIDLLRQAVTQLSLSTRSYFRVLKLGRTIADLAGESEIKLNHIAEALQYRPKVE